MTDEDAPAEPDFDVENALSAELEAMKAENAALRDQALRYAAEAENTKRRAEREANDARAFAIQKFARDLLGVADNLSRALQAAPRESADTGVKNFILGIEMTDKELNQAFERNGLKKVDPAKGAKFDPHVHQAMMEQDAPAEEALDATTTMAGRTMRP